jgi:glycosyltransferase involved in cell wall biosynthesis
MLRQPPLDETNARGGDSLPFVSIVVPTRNRADLLADAVDSVVNQDYPAGRYEVIVVDAGSTDGTPDLGRAFSKRPDAPTVRYFRHERTNANSARNLGIGRASGSLIAFLDDDELAPPEWLASFVDSTIRHPDVECFGGPYRVRYEGRPPRLCPRCAVDSSFDQGDEERQVDRVRGGNMLIRPEAFDRVGRFDEALSGYWDETEWMLRLSASGGRIVYVPPSPIVHRRTPDMMRMGNRLRKAFMIGQQDVQFCGRVGRPTHGLRRFLSTARPLAHAVIRRCSGGLTHAAMSLGYAKATLWHLPLHGDERCR